MIITGTNLIGVTAVTFGGNPATSISDYSDTEIGVTIPAHAPGTVGVAVTAAGGTSTDLVDFTYVAASTVSAVSPATGPWAGGTEVTITGSGFTGTTGVIIGGMSAVSFTVDSDTQIRATTPGINFGEALVVVTATGGTSTDAVYFTYVAAPNVSSVSPAVGPLSGGTTVTITGERFTGVTAVTFGGINAASFTVGSDTQITATTPEHTAGVLPVVVTAAGGTSPGGVHFTYADVPVVSSVFPDAGREYGGVSVIIEGSGFTGATSVTFGGAMANFTVQSDTRIVADTPAHAAGAAPIVVTNPGGSSTGAVTFNYVEPPVVDSVSPASGPYTGGTTVTITGTGFTGATAVTFAGTPATSFTVVSDTEITAVTPAVATGGAEVVVTVPDGGNSQAVLFQFQ